MHRMPQEKSEGNAIKWIPTLKYIADDKSSSAMAKFRVGDAPPKKEWTACMKCRYALPSSISKNACSQILVKRSANQRNT